MVRRKFIEDIAEACYLDYFLSYNDGLRMGWKYRMQPTHEASSTYSEYSDVYVVDSAIQKPELGNREALDAAYRTNADVVLLADYMPFSTYRKSFGENTPQERIEVVERLEEEYSDNHHASLESIKTGLKIYADHAFSGDVWIPLQQPHVEMYEELGRPDNIAVGGLKDSPVSEKIKAVEKLRESVDEGTYIHGLGFGGTSGLIRYVRENPNAIDSIDSQSPMADANNRTDVWPGDDRMSPVVAYGGIQHFGSVP